jgi:hypothetical protein
MSTNTNDQPRRSGRARNLSEKARDTEEQNRSNNANNGLQQYIQNPLQVNNRKDAEEAKDEEEVELRFHPEMLANSSQSRSNRRKQQKLRILADTFKIIAGLDEGLEGMSLKRKLEIINKGLIKNKIIERLSEACAEETKYRKSKGGAQRHPVVMMERGDVKATRKLLTGVMVVSYIYTYLTICKTTFHSVFLLLLLPLLLLHFLTLLLFPPAFLIN